LRNLPLRPAHGSMAFAGMPSVNRGKMLGSAQIRARRRREGLQRLLETGKEAGIRATHKRCAETIRIDPPAGPPGGG